MWCQNAASRRHVASPDVASRIQYKWRHRMQRQNTASRIQVASPDAVSKRVVTKTRGVRESRGIWPARGTELLCSFAIVPHGAWCQNQWLVRRHDTTRRRRMWHHNLASGARDRSGVTGCGVSSGHQGSGYSQHVFPECVFSLRAMHTCTGDNPGNINNITGTRYSRYLEGQQ